MFVFDVEKRISLADLEKVVPLIVNGGDIHEISRLLSLDKFFNPFEMRLKIVNKIKLLVDSPQDQDINTLSENLKSAEILISKLETLTSNTSFFDERLLDSLLGGLRQIRREIYFTDKLFEGFENNEAIFKTWENWANLLNKTSQLILIYEHQVLTTGLTQNFRSKYVSTKLNVAWNLISAHNHKDLFDIDTLSWVSESSSKCDNNTYHQDNIDFRTMFNDN